MRDWLLHGERLRHSHYYNLMENLQEKDSGSEFLAGCFDQTAAFFLLAFLLWPLVVSSVSETVKSETGSVCWEWVGAKILASTRFVIFSFIRRSQAFVTNARACVNSIRNIRKGLTRNSAHCL